MSAKESKSKPMTENNPLNITGLAAHRSQTSLANPSRFSPTNVTANTQHTPRAVTAPKHVPAHQRHNPCSGHPTENVPVHQHHNPRPDHSAQKSSMQTWRAESAADQPWNGLALGQSHAGTAPKKK
ncbi:hypothetical protein EPUS_01522 [Endocarpon pusillum Z07020]|uniref:Uncharacterized protein n=1 Tax=Endocarpon pusillum (strain Z07020 / HMAS-L-300199) TaxID=1263415 RepID=U1GDM5_ENDPU|nr:uncharacterized protein EPUS_01522 [Endocarpon pusillum Z07020]ERF75692.1 hypothetical protein EPUS_01522 [Endocarpon pusillum Z07020]